LLSRRLREVVGLVQVVVTTPHPLFKCCKNVRKKYKKHKIKKKYK